MYLEIHYYEQLMTTLKVFVNKAWYTMACTYTITKSTILTSELASSMLLKKCQHGQEG